MFNVAAGKNKTTGSKNAWDLKNIGGTSIKEDANGDITIIAIDELKIENVGLIKIDVEGFDESVIAGAFETIRQYHPVIVVEIGHSTNHFDSINGMLKELGYAAYPYDEENYIFSVF